MKISTALDSIISVFFPQSALKRKYYRDCLSKAKRSETYAAAKTDRMTGAWSPTSISVNDLIRNSGQTVRNRIRQLVRDFPYFKRAVQITLDYTVGDGIMFQSRILKPDGKLDKVKNTQTEDAFRFFADEADVSGNLHLYEMMRLSKRQDLENGEFLFVKVKSRKRNSFLPFAYQIFEPEQLADQPYRPVGKAYAFDQGMEYDPKTGRVVAYHLYEPDSYGSIVRIKAENVRHKFEVLRPGQRRGISPFTPAVLIARDVGEYLDAEIDRAKMQSKYLAIVHAENPIERQGNVITDTETSQKIDELQNAIIEYLRPGEDITFASAAQQGANFDPAMSLLIRMISITIPCPFELLAGDYTGFSYSTGRISRNDYEQQLRPISSRHVRHFCLPVVGDFYNEGVMSGKLDYPGFFNSPWKWMRNEWQPPGMAPIDPLKETKAAVDMIKTLQKSPQEIMRGRGKDPEEVLKDFKQFREMADEYGLGDIFNNIISGNISTATANNPDAVMNDQEEKIDRVVNLFREIRQ